MRALGMPRLVDTLLGRVRMALGRERPRVSVVVATVGRPSLQRAVDSAAWADEVIVVYDGAELPSPPPRGATVYAYGPTRHWGAEQRNLGISRARGTHLAFLDDDDVYTADAREAIERALTARPSRVHIFRMRRGDRIFGGHGCIWLGGIGTPMFVVPNDDRVGRWSLRYAGDFDFISSTLAASRGRPRFHEDVIALVQP
jgi:Glycosyl transferase family 2